MDLETAIALHRAQAEWTRPMRSDLYRRVRLATRKRVADVGCGDGVITEEMAAICRGGVIGVDSDPEMIELARKRASRVEYIHAEAGRLPFDKSSLDLVTCHWLFLWLEDPMAALKDFRRVLRPGGKLLAACEPDYGGRVVCPREAELKEYLIRAFESEGGHPLVGRELVSLFTRAGFEVEAGLYPGAWTAASDRTVFEREESFLRSMLSDVTPVPALKSALTALGRAAEDGSAVISTPVFWAIGTAPV